MSTTDASTGLTAAPAPRHLWVVGILALLWIAIGAFDYLMTQTENAQYLSQFTPAQLEYVQSMPAWVVSAWAISIWSGVAAAVVLLMRRRLAEHLFLVSLLGLVATTFYNFVLSNGAEVFADTFSRVFMAVVFVVAVALYLYARAMNRRGVLH